MSWQESNRITVDDKGQNLPWPFTNQINAVNGLIGVVPAPVVSDERGTYAWLYDKIMLLYDYAGCYADDPTLVYLQGLNNLHYAPGFGPGRFYNNKAPQPTRIAVSAFNAGTGVLSIYSSIYPYIYPSAVPSLSV